MGTVHGPRCGVAIGRTVQPRPSPAHRAQCSNTHPREGAVRVHIITDLEGVAGITRWEQVQGGAPMFDEARRLYTEEINAAVRGAKAAGGSEIVVMDHHGAGREWSFNSLVP